MEIQTLVAELLSRGETVRGEAGRIRHDRAAIACTSSAARDGLRLNTSVVIASERSPGGLGQRRRHRQGIARPNALGCRMFRGFKRAA